MVHEFTNALAQTPLWQFALQCYAEHQTALLHWQDTHHVHVNDLLLLAYAQQSGQSAGQFWWQEHRIRKVRSVLSHVRQLRWQRKGTAEYDRCKQLELELEGIDILLLNQCLVTGSAYTSTDLILHYERHSSLKKGTLVPFISTLQCACH
jgi:hypothetical protein